MRASLVPTAVRFERCGKPTGSNGPLKAGAFESCRFADWQNQAVTIRGARSASAIYSRPYESWLVLGNLNESAQEVGVVLHPDKLPYLFRQR